MTALHFAMSRLEKGGSSDQQTVLAPLARRADILDGRLRLYVLEEDLASIELAPSMKALKAWQQEADKLETELEQNLLPALENALIAFVHQCPV